MTIKREPLFDHTLLAALIDERFGDRTAFSRASGIADYSVSRYLSSTRSPDLITSITIANTLGTTVQQLWRLPWLRGPIKAVRSILSSQGWRLTKEHTRRARRRKTKPTSWEYSRGAEVVTVVADGGAWVALPPAWEEGEGDGAATVAASAPSPREIVWAERRAEVSDMYAGGMPQAGIAQKLGVSQSWVSKVIVAAGESRGAGGA